MHKHSFVLAAGAVLFASHAAIAAPQVPYTLHAIHADLQDQLEDAAAIHGDIGKAAHVASRLLAPHNAAQEQSYLSLPQAGEEVSPAGSTGQPQAGDTATALMTALVDLYAIASEGDREDVSRIAERLIWHEMTDIEFLLPAAARVSATAQTQPVSSPHPVPGDLVGALYGADPTPLMGVGNPHGPEPQE